MFLKVKDASLVGGVLQSPALSGPSEASQDSYQAFGEQIMEQSRRYRPQIPHYLKINKKKALVRAHSIMCSKNAEHTPRASLNALNEELSPL